MGMKRAFHPDGFVFSRLTVAACTLPAGNKAHEPDSCLPTAISRITAPAPMDSHLSPTVLPFDPAVCRGGAPYYKERGIWRLEPERMARRPNETSRAGAVDRTLGTTRTGFPAACVHLLFNSQHELSRAFGENVHCPSRCHLCLILRLPGQMPIHNGHLPGQFTFGRGDALRACGTERFLVYWRGVKE